MGTLHIRMSFLVIVLFGILYMLVSLFMQAMGVQSFAAYAGVAVLMMLFQFSVGPKIVEFTMGVKYIGRDKAPWLFEMVEGLARKAKIPTPKIGVSSLRVPNAFAFGRGVRDGRVCVTEGILHLLDREELKAVLGHEISHIKNRDVLFITFLSVIPLILYRIFFHLSFFGSSSRRENNNSAALLGLVAFIFYLITNLLVLYASRIREYFADRGAIALGNDPSTLASALYKLVYGAARSPEEEIRQVEGVKAFFLNDISRSRREIHSLSQLDLDRSGTIDQSELRLLRNKKINVDFTGRLMEVFSTHPNMLKRIKHLSEYTKN